VNRSFLAIAVANIALCIFCAAAAPARAQAQEPDPEIAAYVNTIKAIDNHSHVTALDRDHDKGYDQLRCDGLPHATSLGPANLRFGADEQAAYKTLFKFDAKTGDDAETKKIIELEMAARREHGTAFYSWVMDKAGVATVLANRTAMAPEMKPPQFRWVAYEDALLFPLDNSAAKSGLISFKAPFVLARNFETNFSTKWLHKDVGLALESGKSMDVPLPITALTEQMLRATIAKGWGDDDFCSAIRVLEEWASVEVRKE